MLGNQCKRLLNMTAVCVNIDTHSLSECLCSAFTTMVDRERLHCNAVNIQDRILHVLVCNGARHVAIWKKMEPAR